MRRTLLAALATLALAVPVAHAGAPVPQVTDPAGDWYVPSQDVLSGRISSVLVRGVPHLRGELRLAAPPQLGAPTYYDLMFRIGCEYYSFALDWDGTSLGGNATFDHWDWCYADPEPYGGPEGRHPVSFALRGSTLTFQTRYVAGIRRGQRAVRFNVQSCPRFCGVAMTSPDVVVNTGDYAASNASYVVGSDLPRR